MRVGLESENARFIIHNALSPCLDSIDDYNKLQYNQSKEQAWQRYVDCDGLPRVSVPAEMRTMLSELRHYEALESRSTVNWELSVDERCVLSQNIYRKDLTRKTLLQTVRPNIGAFYDKAVANILITLERIVLMLHNEHDMRDIPSSRITEILAVSVDANGNSIGIQLSFNVD